VTLSCSGHSGSVPEGLHVLRELLQRPERSGEPSILPGGGINSETVRDVLNHLSQYGLKEIHLSGGRWVDGRMVHRRAGMGMGASEESEWKVWLTDGDLIRKVRGIADDSAISG